MRFEQYIYRNETQELLEFILLIDSYNLNEGIIQDIKTKLSDILKSSGLHIKQGKGIIHHLINAEKHISTLMYHALMSYYKHPSEQAPHKIKLKELVSKVNKEDIIDFLLKLDTLTMHMITGPIHMIDAAVGTHLWANVSDSIGPAKEKARVAIKSLESLKNTLEGKLKNQVTKYSNALRRVFSIGNMKKVTEEIIGSDISGDNGEGDPDILIGDKCPITGKKRKDCKCKDCVMRRNQE